MKRTRQRTTDERLNAVLAYVGAKSKGLSNREAERLIGVSHVTLWRWNRAYTNKGLDGLVARKSPGRPSATCRILKGRSVFDSLNAAVTEGRSTPEVDRLIRQGIELLSQAEQMTNP